jgi:adenine-specific DNA-methyltransferase
MWLSLKFGQTLAAETVALDGNTRAMADYMAAYTHAANSERVRRYVRRISSRSDRRRYQLASLYYAGGYFSLRQSIQLDAIRQAIDSVGPGSDWLIAAWLSVASTVINAPGHTAQFLKPSTPETTARIQRCWRRNIWDLFKDRLTDIHPVGHASWRSSNRVLVGDAARLVAGPKPEGLEVVYADPPYTRDQYSRYYHVYETLYAYDFPNVTGIGRSPTERFHTAFSQKSQVATAFRQLIGALKRWDVQVVISYPSDGLLTKAGGSVRDIAHEQGFKSVTGLAFASEHSTMGASKGIPTKYATENLYVFS